jgi:hypothetical protein
VRKRVIVGLLGAAALLGMTFYDSRSGRAHSSASE